MNKDQTNSEQRDDLLWLAFCYVADELEPEQMAEFEGRMADDQSVRDAVAEAMAIGQVGCQALDLKQPVHSAQASTRTSPKKSYRAGFVFAASIAMALLMGSWAYYSINQNGSTPDLTAQDSSPSDTIAMTWAMVTSEITNDNDESWPIDEAISAKQISNVDWEVVDEDDASWMMVALGENEDSESKDALQ